MASVVGIYLGILLLLSFMRKKRGLQGPEEYFLANRGLGYFAMAMSISATYVNASSFIGGPGVAYQLGLAWVFLAVVQFPVSMIIFGLIGQHVHNLGRKHNLFDLGDYLQYRYQSKVYTKLMAWMISFVLLLSLLVGILGGARLLQGAMELSYGRAVLIFTAVLALYTLWGGLKAVVFTDILQGGLMIVATLGLFVFLWMRLDGASGIERLAASSTENMSLFSPTGNGKLPFTYTINFIILVGIGMASGPSTFSRLLVMGSRQDLRKSIVISTLITGILTLFAHMNGFLGHFALPELNSADEVMGSLARLLPGQILSGIFVSAMLAAVMSSVDTTLNVLGLTIYRHILPTSLSAALARRKDQGSDGQLLHFLLSRILSLLCICLVAFLALRPPQLLVTLNLYTLSTSQAVLLWPVLLGVFWRRGGKRAAIFSSLAGFAANFAFNWGWQDLGSIRLLPLVLSISGAAYLVGAMLEKKESPVRLLEEA